MYLDVHLSFSIGLDMKGTCFIVISLLCAINSSESPLFYEESTVSVERGHYCKPLYQYSAGIFIEL
ncbi:hypothetical protein HanIR_Chr02g0059431 [Helianthus annuus]|nr:hypothetical protein HanIR_Chr02g0059431 [Helianthus annuus]